jgi:hypothetical protein
MWGINNKPVGGSSSDTQSNPIGMNTPEQKSPEGLTWANIYSLDSPFSVKCILHLTTDPDLE